MPQKRNPILLTRSTTHVDVTVQNLTFGGEGVARMPDGKVVFIPGVFPPEEVRIQVVQETSSYCRGQVTDILTPHPDRIQPACPVADLCGGCQFWALPPKREWELKWQAAMEALLRTAKLTNQASSIAPSLLGPNPHTQYRRRLRFQVKGGPVGFFNPRSHQLCPVPDCPVAHPSLVAAAREFERLTLPECQGWILLELDQDEQQVAGLYEDHSQFPQRNMDHLQGAFKAEQKRFRHLTGLKLQTPPDRTSKKRTPQIIQTVGEPTFRLSVHGRSFSLPVGTFTQANTTANEQLIQQVLNGVDPQPDHSTLELYCGWGNLSFPLAHRGTTVTALEIDQSGVDAGQRLALAQTKAQPSTSKGTVRFQRRDLSKGLPPTLKRGRQSFDSVLLDPPRSGAGEVIQDVIAMAPRRIAYVSCSPPTLGRDLGRLLAGGYGLSQLTFIDMFPRTYHLEVVAILERD